jgi:DNA-binding transcriptional LysR family regulator
MGVTPPAVSRRLSLLERRLGVRLLQRTTRRIHLTPEGEAYLHEGARILADLEALERTVSGTRATARGPLAIACTLGFGRQRLAPALSAFAHAYPEVQVQLQLTDRPVNLVEQGFDAVVRFGALPDSALTARLLLPNRRVLCAAPAYLQAHGMPAAPEDLAAHRCLGFTGLQSFPQWELVHGQTRHTVLVRGPLVSNDSEALLTAAVMGVGILAGGDWLMSEHMAAGRLVRVLPDWRLDGASGIYFVRPSAAFSSAAMAALRDCLSHWFATRSPWRTPSHGA